MTVAPPSTGPLAGHTVIDLSRALAGPHATMLLGDLGARVIKVESPGVGDDTRGWGPPFVGPDAESISTYFLSCNRNKESIALNLKADDDRAVLETMIGAADVLVENFRPGTMDRLGLGSDRLLELNPRLVILSISGFGHDGPEGGRAGYDQIAQGEAGLMSLTGADPEHLQRVGVPIADLLAGITGALGVLAALTERATTGRGQVVRTSLLASLIGVHAFEGTRWTVARQVGHAGGNQHPSIAPYGAFACADGAVQISVGSESLWRAFAPAFDIDPDDPRFMSNADRVAHRDELTAQIESHFALHGRDELLAVLESIGVPAGRIRTIDEVYEWDQTRSQGLVVSVEHPVLGPIELPGPPLRFFGEDGAEITRREHSAPPRLDEHGGALRREFAGSRS